jgi:Glycosyl transferase family 90
MVYQHTSVVSSGAGLSSAFTKPDLHPIEKLAVEGQTRFSELLTSQSNTLKKAVAEYIRRYKRRPPPGFDKWFIIAEREDYVLLDEFDIMMETLEPFWGIPASQLRSRVNAAFKNPRLIRFNISNAIVGYDHEGWAPWMAEQVQSWLPPEWRLILPNMTFAVNILDEPRVLAPHEILSKALHDVGMNKSLDSEFDISEDQGGEVDFFKVDRQEAWQAMASACSVESPVRSESSVQAEYRNLTFVADPIDALDVCTHSSLHKTHGFLSSPDSLDITHSLVPLFSQGKASIFNDILFPSPYYAGRMDQEDYVEKEDPNWSKKSDTLTWSGATTGGHSTITNWQTLHRQRLLLSLKPDSPDVILLNETSPAQWIPHTVSPSELQPLFNLKMIAAVQCEPAACSAQRTAFNITPFDDQAANPNRDPLNATYQSKYVLDMDGNGFSGRYYRLLKSRSAVIKQTIFREWHDRHLLPWVHYIPLSIEADELPEIIRFFTRDPRGKRVGERIARESRSWANITLRKIDLQLAFWRLLLEYGRLVADERDDLFYEA